MILLYRKRMLIVIIGLLTFSLVSCSQATKNEDSQSTSELELNDESNQSEKKKLIDENEKADRDSKDNHKEEKKEMLEIDIDNDNSLTVLVNKQHSLKENYEPDDLVTVNVPTILENPEVNQLRKEAADALKEMFDVALDDGISLYARSGYRSHNTQEMLFENYAQKHGEEAANRYSARAGQSEHQTGLVMDITSESVNFQLVEEFANTEEGKWVQENAHQFGFIIRYPKGKEDITGYIYEPWHLRYLGVEVATAVYESGLTYEEFLKEEGIIHETSS